MVLRCPGYEEDPPLYTSGATQSVFNVREFGAKGDGATDDTAAIQEAIDRVRRQGGEVYFPVGTYSISSLNLTRIHTGVVLRGAGTGHQASRLIPNKDDVHLLDFSGSCQLNMENLQIGHYPQLGQQGSFREDIPVPKTAILLAQVPGYESNAFHFEDLQVTGKYHVATFYCYGVPSSTMLNCDFFNYQDEEGAAVVAFTRDNYAELRSDYTNVFTGAYGGFAGTNTSDWTLTGVEIHQMSGVWNHGGRTKVTPLRLDTTMQMRWIGGNVSGEGPQSVHFVGSNMWINFIGTTFYSDFPPVPEVLFRNDGQIRGLTVSGCVTATSNAVFGGGPDSVFDEISFQSKAAHGGAKVLFDAPGATLTNSLIHCDGLGMRLGDINKTLLINPGEIQADSDTSTKVQ